MTGRIIQEIMTMAIVAAVMFVLNRMFPPMEKHSSERMEALKKEFAASYRVWFTLYMIMVLAFAALWLWGLREAWEQQYLKPRSSSYYFHMEWTFWILPSLLLGIVTPAYPLLLLYRTLLGERFEKFMQYLDGRSKVNLRHLLPWTTGLVLIGNILAYPYAQNYFIAFETDVIRWNRFTTTKEQQYGFDQVVELIKYSSRTSSLDTYYMIEFDDGHIWSSRSLMTAGYLDQHANLFRFLEQKTGLRMKTKIIK